MIVSEPEGKYAMRFVGRPNGKLMKGSPSNYTQNQIYQMTWNNCKFKFWELLEETPELVIPDDVDSDSIYEEPIYVPDGGISMSGTPVEVPDDVNLDPYGEASIDPYMTLNSSSGELTEYTVSSQPIEEVVELTRDELKAKLDEAGVEYKSNARTTTLRKLVDGLSSES